LAGGLFYPGLRSRARSLKEKKTLVIRLLVIRGFVIPAFLLSLWSSSIQAQTQAERAGEITEEAARAARAGDYATALAQFEEAYRLDPVPILLFHIGRVKARMGDLRGAVETLERYLGVAPDEDGRVRARAALGEARSRLAGRVTVRSAVDGAVVELDGAPVGRTPLASPLEVTPGAHVIRVVAARYIPFERTVQVRPDEALDVSALLVATGEPPPNGQDEPPDRTLTWVLVGTGAAVLVAGGVTAAVLLSGGEGGGGSEATWTIRTPLEVGP
jgi:tetratricopeptide (TPR) repeat protein